MSADATSVVRIAVVDSGVHAAHPHVQGVAGGVGIDADGRPGGDWIDRLGHGTAVTAAIREKAPSADIYAVKVFDRELATTAAALVAGIDWAIAERCTLVNLSLGTSNPDHREALAGAVVRACAAGVWVVAAGAQDGVNWLPGALPGVIAVELDWTLARDRFEVIGREAGGARLKASGYPRPIPGVSPSRNLKGISFAVANVTGLLASGLEQNRALIAKIVNDQSTI